MKTRYIALGVAVMALAASQSAFAQSTASSVLTVNATVAATAKLTMTGGDVNFPDADPDSISSIGGGTITVAAKAKTTAAGAVSLTMTGANLVSGSNSIPASRVSWTVTGTGYSAGTMANGTSVPVGSWTGSGNRQGTMSFFLANSWDYAAGTYAASATFTLTAP